MTTGEVIALIKSLGSSGGGGMLVVNVSDGVLDKTYSEILASTTPVVIHQASEGASYWGFVTAVFDDDGEYTVVVTDSSAQAVSYYIADSVDGYPELEQG